MTSSRLVQYSHSEVTDCAALIDECAEKYERCTTKNVHSMSKTIMWVWNTFYPLICWNQCHCNKKKKSNLNNTFFKKNKNSLWHQLHYLHCSLLHRTVLKFILVFLTTFSCSGSRDCTHIDKCSVHSWMSCQFTALFVRICGFGTLFKSTSAVVWRCSDSTGRFQNTFNVLSASGLKQRTLHFSAQTRMSRVTTARQLII